MRRGSWGRQPMPRLFFSAHLVFFLRAYAFAARAAGRACLASQAFRNSVRRASTYSLASFRLRYTRLPLMVLQGPQQATKFLGSFLPFFARGTTKSTRMIRAFSKLALPSSPQYWQR